MDKNKFVAEVEKKLTTMFRSRKEGFPTPPEDRHRLEGFIQAGIFMGLATKDELQSLMEQIYMEIFGKSIKERQTEALKLWPAEGRDYSRYEQPSYERIRDQ